MEARSHLLDLDADLASAVQDSPRRRQASRALTATVLGLLAGERLDVGALATTAPLGTLLLEGFLVREITTSGRVSAELLGPDDLVRPAEVEEHASPLRHNIRWTALTAVRLALLDGDFMHRGAPWPEIGGALIERAARPGRRLASGRAIGTLPSVDMRLLASLWDWASHWGFVGSSGVRLSLPLSHSRIGHLIGAQRPTVTAALRRLREQGLVEQPGDGDWLLRPPSDEHPEADVSGLRMPMLEDLSRSPAAGTPRRAAAHGTRVAGMSAAGASAAGASAAGASTAGATTRLAAAGTSSESVTALQLRLAAQRETLGIAAARHAQMLVRLQRESVQLRENSATLSRLARRPPADPRPGAGADGREPTEADAEPSAAARPGAGREQP